MLKKGDLVTRNKYNNDIIFKIEKIEKDIVYLKGYELRLYADAKINDLKVCNVCKKKESNNKLRDLDKNKFFIFQE